MEPIKESISTRTHERYWEIDSLRGFLIAGMIIFHTIFLLGIIGFISTGIWESIICGDIIPGIRFELIHLGTSLFVITCGLSLVLRLKRMEGLSRRTYNLAALKRGLIVLALGIGVAIVANIIIHFFIGGEFMYFNFLMMMGVCMILAIPFVRLGKWNFIIGPLFILLGFFLSTINGPIGLLPFGIIPDGFFPRDYFPIFPWLGIMITGIAIGSVLYPNGNRKIEISNPNIIGRFLSVLGRKSLIIYLAHIPIIGGILLLIKAIMSLF